MDITSDIELQKLSQAVTEALEIEKCSICLEKLHDTVVLWPCTHWFCKHCITRLQSAQRKNINCPICKGKTSRRTVLPFHDKQTEYEDHLQSLIGAISLDLGFDITSYRNAIKNGKISPLVHVNTNECLSPIRKTRLQSSLNTNKKETEPDTSSYKNKKVMKKLGSLKKPRLDNVKIYKVSSVDSSEMSESKDPKIEKVKDWLHSSTFSKADQDGLTETVVVDIHKSEIDSSALSEEQLLSVTQVETKLPYKMKLRKEPKETASDIDAIKPFDDSCCEKNISEKQNNTSADTRFDDLLDLKPKTTVINNTYGNKNTYVNKQKSGKCFTVNSDIFKSVIESKEGLNSQHDEEKLLHLSQTSFEDFSSGSGEEWTIDKETKRNVHPLKHKQNKNKKTLIKEKKESCKTKSLDKIIDDQSVKTYNKIDRNVIKHIMDEWSDTKDGNNIKDNSDEYNKALYRLSTSTPIKQNNKRSPGWSKLDSTKKDFHMSEKKRLSLKTFGKPTIGIVPLNLDNKCNNEEGKELVEYSKSLENKDVKRSVHIRTEELNGLSFENQNKELIKKSTTPCCSTVNITDMNRSFTCSTPESPFKGFKSPPEIKNPRTLNVVSNQIISLKQNRTESCDMDQNKSISIDKENTNKNINQDTFKINCSDHRKDHVLLIPKEGGGSISHSNVVLQKVKTIQENGTDLEIKITEFEPKTMEHTGMIGKRSRDSGIHDESTLYSPVRKRICRDAEVQTSPGRMHSFVKDLLKSTFGIDSEKLFKTSSINTPAIEKLSQNQVQMTYTNTNRCNSIETDIHNSSSFNTNRLSQNSDKENMEMVISEQSFNDSDFVIGTEDYNNSILKTNSTEQRKQLKAQLTKCNSPLIEKGDLLNIKECVIDQDAPTQLYKTPNVPRKILQSSTNNLYSVVSNPTDSELKRIDIFDKSDVNILDDSVKPHTPWNNSGISQLESNTKTLINPEGKLQFTPTQISKEKAHRSRRQLDFIDEGSLSDDMFETLAQQESSGLNGVTEEKNKLLKSREEKFLIVEKKENNTTNQSRLSDDEVSLVGSEDLIVEGTPDIQANMLKTKVTENISKETSNFKLESNGTNLIPYRSVEDEIEKRADEIKSVENREMPVVNNNNQPEESNDKIIGKEADNSDDETEQLCFSSSLLNAKQKQVLNCLLEEFNIPYSTTVGPHISHLVVGTRDGCTQNTYKFLHAIALHKTIITYDWVEKILNDGEVSMNAYLARDERGECGVLRAQADKERTLLCDFAIYIYNVIEDIIKKENLEELLRLCGATVVSEVQHFNTVPRDKFRVIAFSEFTVALSQADFRQKYHAAEVSVDWVYNTISQYRVKPLAEFMIDSSDAVPFLVDEGYPEILIYNTTQPKPSIQC